MTRNFFYASVSAGSAVLLLLLSIVITNALGQGPWGDFMFALSMALIGEALMDFGIHQVTIRSIARDRSTAAVLFRNSLSVKLLPGLGMFVALGALTFIMHREPELRLATVLMLAAAVFRSYVLTVRGVLQGLESFRDFHWMVAAWAGWRSADSTIRFCRSARECGLTKPEAP